VSSIEIHADPIPTARADPLAVDFAVTAGGEIEPRTISGANELSGHQQNLLTQGLERGVLKLWRQPGAFEPIDQNCRRAGAGGSRLEAGGPGVRRERGAPAPGPLNG
jgi:hypothetical protein